VQSYCNVTSGCVNVIEDCSDNIGCTVDACNNGQCSNTPSNTLCPQPSDKCTIVKCSPNTLGADPSSGCVTSPLTCNDNIACTDDYCDSTCGCVFTPDDSQCSVTNPCQVAICSPTLGCITQPMNCDDCNPCTVDTCSGGQCFHATSQTICNDGLKCTTDVCKQETDTSGNPLPNSFSCTYTFNPTNCGILPHCQTPLCGINNDCSIVTNDSLCPVLVDNGVTITCLVPQCTLASGCGLRDTCAGNPGCNGCAQCNCNTNRNSCFPTCPTKRSLPLDQDENGGHVVSFTLLNLFGILCLVFINKF